MAIRSRKVRAILKLTARREGLERKARPKREALEKAEAAIRRIDLEIKGRMSQLTGGQLGELARARKGGGGGCSTS